MVKPRIDDENKGEKQAKDIRFCRGASAACLIDC